MKIGRLASVKENRRKYRPKLLIIGIDHLCRERKCGNQNGVIEATRRKKSKKMKHNQSKSQRKWLNRYSLGTASIS